MDTHSKRQSIIKAILNNWWQLPNVFRSEKLISLVEQNTSFMVYPDTILRYMRHLKQEGKINYQCTNRKERHYIKLKNHPVL